MEALAAFGVAANVLQIVDFSVKLLSTGHQVLQTGSTVNNSELEVVAKDLRALSENIKRTVRPAPTIMGCLSKDDQGLENLANDSTKVADELLVVLSELQLQGDRRKWKSFRQAIKTTWNKSRIDETAKRLETIRDELQFRILVSMRSNVDTLALRNDQGLLSFDDATRKIIEAILDNKDELKAELEAQTKGLYRRHDLSDALALERHEKTMSAIQSLPLHFGRRTSTNIGQQNSEIHLQAQETLLANLGFKRMDDRYEDISPTHGKTFEWIYGNAHTQKRPWSNFVEWLQKGSGIYWISGKAGSGKSTLMKFLNRDHRTQEALASWANGTPLFAASFYFWSNGTELQRSQRGLLRSLLYEILKKQPDMGPVLFPDMFGPKRNWDEFPTFHELKRAFRRLTTQDVVPIKVALLIDGLDEYDTPIADMSEIADVFKAAVSSSSVKAVLSSRPLPTFEESFANCAKLRLHELTFEDIATYVNDRISRHSRIMQLSQEDPFCARNLITEIVTSASGVFLWVKLVVRSLLEGLRNFDTVFDLQQRLQELPQDLEDLFRYMLRKVAPQYRRQSSQIVQVVRHYQVLSDQLSRYAVVVDGSKKLPSRYLGPLTAMGLSFAESDPRFVFNAEAKPLTATEKELRLKETEGRLRSRCAGLIELRFSANSFDVLDETQQASVQQEPDDAEVQFLHKSVADFLAKPDVWEEILATTRDTDFDANVYLLRSVILQIKTWSPRRGDYEYLNPVLRLVDHAMELARRAETSTGRAEEKLLDELDSALAVHCKAVLAEESSEWDIFRNHHLDSSSADIHWSDLLPEYHVRPAPWHGSFLSFAVRNGLVLYVQAKLDGHGETIVPKKGRPLLDYACYPIPDYNPTWQNAIDPKIVEILLQNKADANEKFNGWSPWQNALYSAGLIEVRRWAAILKLFILHDADPNAYIERDYILLGDTQSTFRYSALYVIQQFFFGGVETAPDSSVGSAERALGKELVKLLEKRGGKERKWHLRRRRGKRGFEQVYPTPIWSHAKELLGRVTN
ncbi:MAG: hypothetical protein M1813_005937 [Trichoglossum hirsutum]|nr:MAG: hypothetical protein M1813_005937 [Trichoglossum hirsutum]